MNSTRKLKPHLSHSLWQYFVDFYSSIPFPLGGTMYSAFCRAALLLRTKNEYCKKEDRHMLWTIFVILLVLWLLGMVSSYTLGGYIHILLIVAIVVLLIRVIQGRSPV